MQSKTKCAKLGLVQSKAFLAFMDFMLQGSDFEALTLTLTAKGSDVAF